MRPHLPLREWSRNTAGTEPSSQETHPHFYIQLSRLLGFLIPYSTNDFCSYQISEKMSNFVDTMYHLVCVLLEFISVPLCMPSVGPQLRGARENIASSNTHSYNFCRIIRNLEQCERKHLLRNSTVGQSPLTSATCNIPLTL